MAELRFVRGGKQGGGGGQKKRGGSGEKNMRWGWRGG